MSFSYTKYKAAKWQLCYHKCRTCLISILYETEVASEAFYSLLRQVDKFYCFIGNVFISFSPVSFIPVPLTRCVKLQSSSYARHNVLYSKNSLKYHMSCRTSKWGPSVSKCVKLDKDRKRQNNIGF